MPSDLSDQPLLPDHTSALAIIQPLIQPLVQPLISDGKTSIEGGDNVGRETGSDDVGKEGTTVMAVSGGISNTISNTISGSSRYFGCSVLGCSHISKRYDNFKRHQATIHSIGMVTKYPCSVVGCSYTSLAVTQVRRHGALIHSIGILKTFPCSVQGCIYVATSSRDLKETPSDYS